SRFVQRFAAVARKEDWDRAKARGASYLAFAAALEAAEQTDPLPPPNPAPKLAARPKQLSMSDMRDLTRDPYSNYARKILRLHKMDAVDEEPGAAALGTVLHEVLAGFARSFPQEIPANALDELLAAGRRAFASLESFPAALAIWWPRFQRAAKWFVEAERAR